MPVFTIRLADGRVADIKAADQASALAAAKAIPPKVQTDAKERVGNTPDWMRSIANGATLGGADQLDATMAAGTTGAHNLVNRVMGKPDVGYGASDAYKAVLEANHAAERKYRDAHPVVSGGLELAGGLAMPGMGLLADAVGGVKGAKGLLQGTSFAARSLRGGVAGGLLGGVAGGLSADPGKVGDGITTGAGLGAATGGALPAAGQVVAPVVKGAVRLANRASGGRILNASVEAGDRLAEALRKDGLTPDQVKATLNRWLKTGASDPALLDVAGPNTQRLLRAAAGKGGAANAKAVKYVDKIAGSLQDHAANRTRQLTPDARPAPAVAKGLAAKQSDLANSQYRPAYAQTVKIDPAAQLALSGRSGQAVIDKAMAAIQERAPSDPDVAQQLTDLTRLKAGQFDQPVSAATLDTLRINMGERGRRLMDRGAKYQAGGAFGRAGMIDESLDQIPELQPARQTYKGVQAQRDALDLGSTNPFSNPADYSAELDKLVGKATPDTNPHPVSADDIRGAAGVGVRSEMERGIGAPTAGATGYLNRLADSPNVTQVLGDTFGAEGARYQEAIGNEISRLRNARFIDPGNGSQTALRLEDTGLVDIPHPSAAGIARFALSKLAHGLTLTDAEREAIVSLGTTGADDALGQINFNRIAPRSHLALPLAPMVAERAQ